MRYTLEGLTRIVYTQSQAFLPHDLEKQRKKRHMALETKKLLDEVGWSILRALQADARMSFAELGRRVGLSLPAVAERVRRLEEAGIISGYHARVNFNKIGYSMVVFVRMVVDHDRYAAFIATLASWPEVLEGHHLSGIDSFIVKAIMPSVSHLEEFIERLSFYGQTTTTIVLSSPVIRQIIEPVESDQ